MNPKPTKRGELVRAIRIARLTLQAFPLAIECSNGDGTTSRPLVRDTPAWRWTMKRRSPIEKRIKRLEKQLRALGPPPAEFKPRPSDWRDARIRKQYREDATAIIAAWDSEP